MNLEQKVMADMKEAMKAKDEASLRGLRAIKAEIIKAKTEPGAGGELSEDTENKMLQKMMKQRKDSLEIYRTQKRDDLAKKEEGHRNTVPFFLLYGTSNCQIRYRWAFQIRLSFQGLTQNVSGPVKI